MPCFFSSSTAGLESSYSEMSFISMFSSPNPKIPAVPIVLAPFSWACFIISAAVGIVFPPAITISIPSSKWLNKDTESSNPPETLTISTKTGTVNISAGYYTTNFAVSLSDTEKNKIIAGNIRSGVTLLGIAGSSNVINTGSSNISSGQSAITASKILSGYSGFINGAEVKGNIASTTGSA